VNIISSRQRCSRHQIDLKRAICIEHDAKKQEVLFEGVRFMLVWFSLGVLSFHMITS
jgi:hypothetical protein